MFTLKKGKCPEVLLNSKTLPQATDVKSLGLHLDQRLTKAHFNEKKPIIA